MRAYNEKQDSRRTLAIAHRHRPTSYWLVVACWVLSTLLSAQSPALFEAEGPSKEVTEGSRFEVSFTLKNAVAQRFVPPDFKGFRVKSGPTEMRSAGFVNGKSYNQQAWVYELEAGTPGTYTIGTAMAQMANQTLRSQPIVVRVAKAKAGKPKSPAPNSDDRLFVSGELSSETAWVGQQVFYQLKLYTQVGISDYDILDLPEFDGFFSQERRRFDTRVQYETIRGKKYAVRILYEMALFPQQAGELSIGPARVRLGIEPQGGRRSLLGGTSTILQTQPLALRVAPLPDPAPDNFSGGVGSYTWSVSADKSALTTDDALTLTVTIEGNGDPRRFANPRFPLPATLEVFDPKAREQEEYETGDQFVHARTLEYVILPKEPGIYAFLPELVVFDPDSNRYRTLRTEQPVKISVAAGSNYGKHNTLLDTIAVSPSPSSQPFWEDAWKYAAQRLPWAYLWGLIGTLAVLATALFFWKKNKQRTAARVNADEPERPKPNFRTLRTHFHEVGKTISQRDPKVFYHDLLKAVQAYVAARLGTDPLLLTPALLLEMLPKRGVPQHTLDALVQVWDTCERSVFAGQASAQNMLPTWQKADAALQELDAAMR